MRKPIENVPSYLLPRGWRGSGGGWGSSGLAGGLRRGMGVHHGAAHKLEVSRIPSY